MNRAKPDPVVILTACVECVFRHRYLFTDYCLARKDAVFDYLSGRMRGVLGFELVIHASVAIPQ